MQHVGRRYESRAAEDARRDFEVEPVEDTEARRSLFREYVRLGFGYVTSAMMAEARVDLAEVRRLLSMGCSPDTAARILL